MRDIGWTHELEMSKINGEMLTVNSVLIQTQIWKLIVGRNGTAGGRRQQKCVRGRVRYEELEERFNT